MNYQQQPGSGIEYDQPCAWRAGIMKVLGLPGIKPATEKWLHNLLDSLQPIYTDCVVQQYQCWFNPGAEMNMRLESEFASKTGPDLVIAKSIGTRVALYAYEQNMLSASAYVFIGTPFHSCTMGEIDTLKKLSGSIPTLLIQQTGDPVGGYSELTALIAPSRSCQTREVAGNDHVYGDLARLRQIIVPWYKSLESLQL